MRAACARVATVLRITAQLIDAKEDHHLWSERWDRTLEDIFDVWAIRLM